jgi:hypothetical protein
MRFSFPPAPRQTFADRMVKSFAVGAGGLLSLRADIGSVKVEAGQTDELTVEVRRHVEADTPEEAAARFAGWRLGFEQKGNDVEVISGFHGTRRGRPSLEFRVSVPRRYNLELRTGAGNVSVEGVEGEATAATSAGNLSFRDVVGRVNARTAGGNIRAEGVRGSVDAHTSGGSISVERAEGRVTAGTAGGSIRVAELAGEVEATTRGGNVAARMPRQMIADCRLATSGGKVVVELDPASAFDFDAQTRAGSVVTDFPVTMEGRLSGRSCKSSVNGGGPKLVLRSAAGDIHLRKI